MLELETGLDFIRAHSDDYEDPLRTNSSNASTGSSRPVTGPQFTITRRPRNDAVTYRDHETLVPHSDSMARVMTLPQIVKMTHTKTG